MRSRSPFLLIRPFASDTINRKGQESILCQLIFGVLSDNENVWCLLPGYLLAKYLQVNYCNKYLS
jgi:hypothetical protein